MAIRRPMPRRRSYSPRRSLLRRLHSRRTTGGRFVLRARRRLYPRAYYRKAPRIGV